MATSTAQRVQQRTTTRSQAASRVPLVPVCVARPALKVHYSGSR